MSQTDIIEFLKRHPGERFTAEEIQRFLNLGPGAYENLKRLRPKCKWCSGEVEDSPVVCVWCGEGMVYNSPVRCFKGRHKRDSRLHVYFYWFNGGNDE